MTHYLCSWYVPQAIRLAPYQRPPRPLRDIRLEAAYASSGEGSSLVASRSYACLSLGDSARELDPNLTNGPRFACVVDARVMLAEIDLERGYGLPSRQFTFQHEQTIWHLRLSTDGSVKTIHLAGTVFDRVP